MDKTFLKIRNALVGFGVLVLCYNIYEFIIQKYSTRQAIIFIIECLAGIALIFLPELIKKILRLEMPKMIVYFYWFFLFISVFLGTCLHLISIISFWDKILHAVSPMVLTAVGYGIIALFLRHNDLSKVSPWMFLLFGFAFAGLCGIFWEFWEFFCDQFFGMNLQRFESSAGVPFIGRAALMDTMGDLFTNTAGALIMGIFARIQSKGQGTYFKEYEIKKV